MLWLVVQAALIVFFFASSFFLVAVLQYFSKRCISEDEEDDQRKVTRGSAVGTLSQAQRQVEELSRPAEEDPRTLYVGGLWLPRSEEPSHFFGAGTTGSGKTLTSLVQLDSALRRIVRPIGNEQVGAVVYDNKRSLVPYIASIVGMDRIIILNPFDARCYAPDFPSMYDAESLIQLLAEVYVPQRNNDAQPFFTSGPQDLITNVTLVFDERARAFGTHETKLRRRPASRGSSLCSTSWMRPAHSSTPISTQT